MVKLVFNPKKEDGTSLSSLVSKKIEPNLNPLTNFSKEIFVPKEIKEKPETEPKSVKEIVGLENCAYVLNQWYTSNKATSLLIIGPTGCGKTSLIELYCKENSIQIYSVKSSELIKTKKDLLRDLFYFSEYTSTSFFVKSESPLKKLIMIDEYQNNQSDLLNLLDIQNLVNLKNADTRSKNKKELSTFLQGVCKLESVHSFPPILIISADSKGSKLSDLKKTSEVYYINEIPSYIIKTWISKFNNNVSLDIIKKCKSDKRLLLNTLNYIGKNSVDQFIDSFYKDVDINIFEFLNVLFYEGVQLNDIFKAYESDGFMLSNMVHENYLDYNNDIHSIANSAEAISYGEKLFSDTYESSRTFLPDIHCLHSMYIPSYYSRSDKTNKNIRTCCINNRYNIYLNNVKNINKINENKVIPLTIYDIFDIKKILNQSLIKTKVLNPNQEEFLEKIVNSTDNLELIYKHFSDFNDTVTKAKNFTLKFKEKLKKLKER